MADDFLITPCKSVIYYAEMFSQLDSLSMQDSPSHQTDLD